MVSHLPQVTQRGHGITGVQTSGLCEVERALPMESGNVGVTVGSPPDSLCALSLGVSLCRMRSRPAHVVGRLAIGVGWL